MSSVVIAGDTSGSVTLQAPAVAGSTVLTLPAQTGTVMVNGPAFSAYIVAATQTITANTYVKMALTGELFDTNSNFDSTTNYRFTPTVVGYYQVNAMVQSNGSANLLLCAIYKNGVNYSQGSDTRVTGGCQSSVATDLIYMNGSTDYLELYAYSNLTTIIGGNPNSSSSTRLSAFLARSA